MRNKSLTSRLKKLQAVLGWKLWRVGVYESGVLYLEFETGEQYDEWQFEDNFELKNFVDNCYKAVG